MRKILIREKSILVLFLIFTQISCAEIADKSIYQGNKNNDTIPQPSKALDNKSTKIDETYRLVIYSSVLSRVFYDRFKGKIFDEFFGDDWLVYRSETIIPLGIEKIENNQDIPTNLVIKFKQVNQSAEQLEKEYDVEAAVVSNSGDRNLVKFYEMTKIKYPKTKAVVNLSSIGLDETYSQALVYVEYYSPNKGLMKQYFLLSLEKKVVDEITIITGIDNFKILSVD